MQRNNGNSSGKALTFKSFGPAIACFIIVFILVVLPEDELSAKNRWLNISYLDKWVHALMFAVMTFLFLLPIAESNLFKKVKRHYFIRIGIAACIWGLTTEFIQKFFVPTRSFDLLDWAADTAGILLAIFYCRKFHFR